MITVCRGLDIAGLDGIIMRIRRRHIDVDVAVIGFRPHIPEVVIVDQLLRRRGSNGWRMDFQVSMEAGEAAEALAVKRR